MASPVHRVINKYVTHLKGSAYEIDSRISPSYLISVGVERALMMLRGALRFRHAGYPFVGAGVTIRQRGQLSLGRAVTLGHHSYVDALSTDGVRLGDNVSLGRNSRIECTGSLRTLGKGMVVGDNVGLGTDCLYGCAGGIDIGADTIVGNFATFHSENHRIDDPAVLTRLQGVSHLGITIGANCWIGAKVTVLDGAHIGDGCVIAAGSVVTAGTYPGDTIYGGVPAKFLKQRPTA